MAASTTHRSPTHRRTPLRAERSSEDRARVDIDAWLDEHPRHDPAPESTRRHPPVARLTEAPPAEASAAASELTVAVESLAELLASAASDEPSSTTTAALGWMRSALIVAVSSVVVGTLMYFLVLSFR